MERTRWWDVGVQKRSTTDGTPLIHVIRMLIARLRSACFLLDRRSSARQRWMIQRASSVANFARQLIARGANSAWSFMATRVVRHFPIELVRVRTPMWSTASIARRRRIAGTECACVQQRRLAVIGDNSWIRGFCVASIQWSITHNEQWTYFVLLVRYSFCTAVLYVDYNCSNVILNICKYILKYPGTLCCPSDSEFRLFIILCTNQCTIMHDNNAR